MDELNRLIQMAAEAEALERAAESEIAEAPPPAVHVVIGGWRRTVWMSLAGVSGLAACFAVAFVAMRGAPAPILPPGPIAAGPSETLPDRAIALEDTGRREQPVAPIDDEGSRPAEPSDTESVVIALFRAADGSYECVQVDEPKWAGDRSMAEVGRRDLMQVAFQNPCTTIAPQVLLIGVEGKRGTVPTTMRDAQRIAERMRSAPMHQADLSSMAYAALPDLPAGSTVVAETVAIR